MSHPLETVLWHREGNLLYTLQHTGWSRAGEEFKNHLTVRVEVHQGDAAEAAALADRLHRFLSAPSALDHPHASDCALHNAPALETGPCDCGANPAWTEEQIEDAGAAFLEHLYQEIHPDLWDVSRTSAGAAMRAALATLNATPPTPAVPVSREGVARLVDPWAFNQCEWASREDNDAVLRIYIPKRDTAYQKADQILALLSERPVADSQMTENNRG